ncbi:hypothetical protein BGZ73_002680 [Actinomortierella ambigua]|nr:hypothetical protein BGZ73_002680 [Actinomortierella ambigua]
MVTEAKLEQASPTNGPVHGNETGQESDTHGTAPRKRQLFEQSTQYNHWRFTQKSLDAMRARANKDAIEAIKAHIQEEQQLRLAQGGAAEEDLMAEIEFLSPSDEQTLLSFYERFIKQIYQRWKLTSEMWATTLVYFKRFYLENTTMDFHPKDIILTCMFLARKTDNILLPIDDFSKMMGTPAKLILGYESLVCQSLRFHFTASSDNIEKLSLTYETAIKTIDTLMHTDVCFLYQPSQIALAAMKIAAQKEGYDFESYVAFKFLSKPETKEKYETTLLPILQSIEKIFNEDLRCNDVERAVATAIDRRLKKCKDPIKNPESLLYKKRQQEAEEGSNDDDDDDDDDDGSADGGEGRSAKRTKLENTVGPQQNS